MLCSCLLVLVLCWCGAGALLVLCCCDTATADLLRNTAATLRGAADAADALVGRRWGAVTCKGVRHGCGGVRERAKTWDKVAERWTLCCDAMRCDAMRCDAMRCDAMKCYKWWIRCECDGMRCGCAYWGGAK